LQVRGCHAAVAFEHAAMLTTRSHCFDALKVFASSCDSKPRTATLVPMVGVDQSHRFTVTKRAAFALE
jgi:hypothetical protein